MLHSRSVQNYVSARESRLVILNVWLLACALLLPVGIQAQTPATSTARELSTAFRSVARQAVPAKARPLGSIRLLPHAAVAIWG